MFVEVETEDPKMLIVNTDYIVQIIPKDGFFPNGAKVELAKDAAGYPSIHVNGDSAIKLRNLLIQE